MTAQNSEIDLVRHGLVRFDDDTDRVVESVDGTLWITLGDKRDVILEDGESAFVEGGHLILISAVGGTARARVSEVVPEMAAAA